MGTIASILAGVGSILLIVGGIWLLVMAFQTSIGWGLASLFIPFVILFFAAKFWPATSRPTYIWLGGFALSVIGNILVISSM